MLQQITIAKRVTNVPAETILEHVAVNQGRDLPRLALKEPHDRQVVIVGGGPSLKHTPLPAGAEVWALNGAGRYLAECGEHVDRVFVADARPVCVNYVSPAIPGARYYIATQADPAVFEALEGRDVTRWDMAHDGVRSEALVCGGSTVALAAMAIAWIEGCRLIHLVGLDSSLADGEHHAYPQPVNDSDRLMDVVFDDRTFTASKWMVSQVIEFQSLARELSSQGASLIVHGDGLLPHVARQMTESKAGVPGLKFAFHHIPKSGGTSVLEAMKTCMPEHRATFSETEDDPERWLSRFSVDGVYSSHYIFRDWLPREPYVFITWIRDPVDMFYSAYHFYSRVENPKREGWRPAETRDFLLDVLKRHDTLESYVDDVLEHRYEWAFPRQLFDIDFSRFDFIGITEDMAASIEALNQRYGLELEPAHVNATRGGKDYRRDEVREFLAHEVAIYERLRAEWPPTAQ